MKLGRWSLVRKTSPETFPNYILTHAPEWSLAVQFIPVRGWHWFWYRESLPHWPDKLGRDTSMESGTIANFICWTFVRTLGVKMDLGRRLNWYRWWKKETKPRG